MNKTNKITTGYTVVFDKNSKAASVQQRVGTQMVTLAKKTNVNTKREAMTWAKKHMELSGE